MPACVLIFLKLSLMTVCSDARKMEWKEEAFASVLLASRVGASPPGSLHSVLTAHQGERPGARDGEWWPNRSQAFNPVLNMNKAFTAQTWPVQGENS